MELYQSMSYLGQSMELALQSLNIALNIQDKILIRDCSLLLCDTVGLLDPLSSIAYLMLSQVRIKFSSRPLCLLAYSCFLIECKCFDLCRKYFETCM